MENVKVSVIVPAYNVEKYLQKLVDCIIEQDEKSWELILVDDGSKDNTGKICDDAVLQDDRIKVIHQENKGLSGARNSGIRMAKGEWVAFIDADDLVSANYLSSMLSAASVSTQIDLVLCSYAIIESTRTPIMMFQNASYIGHPEISNAFSDTKLLLRCCAWARMYRRNIIIDNGIWYNTQVATEDRPFNYEYFKYIRGLATTSNIGYFYGSFSPMTLKHKKHPVSQYVLRQQILSQEVKELCNMYEIRSEGLFILWRNIMGFLIESIEGAYYQSGRGANTEEVQRSIMLECFDVDWHNKMMQNDMCKSFYANNPMLQMVVNGHFAKFNKTIMNRDLHLHFRQIVHRLLRKKNPMVSYETAITMLN